MLFQSLNRLKRSSVVISMILMASGLVMIICPERFVNSLIEGLGYCMLILAVVQVLDYLNSKKVLMNVIVLTLAMILGLLGLSVLIFRDSVLRILSCTFGIVLVLQGIDHFYNALMYVKPSGKKGWWILAVMSAMLTVAGIIIFVNLWWHTPRALLKVVGAILLFDAAVEILRLIWIWPIKGE